MNKPNVNTIPERQRKKGQGFEKQEPSDHHNLPRIEMADHREQRMTQK